MNAVRSNNISLKYQRFTTLGFKDVGIRKSEFVAKNQLLYWFLFNPQVSNENLDIAELVYKTIQAVQYNTHPIDQERNIAVQNKENIKIQN